MTSDTDASQTSPHPRAPCSRVVALLADYLAQRLSPPQQTELTRHLDECQPCLAQLHTYRSTVSLLRSLREEDLPAELRRTLKSFLERDAAN